MSYVVLLDAERCIGSKVRRRQAFNPPHHIHPRGSPQKLQTKLNFSWRPRRYSTAEGGIAKSRVQARKLSVIEEIEELCPELNCAFSS